MNDEFSVFVEHELGQAVDEDQVDDLIDAFDAVGARGAALSIGPSVGVQFSVGPDEGAHDLIQAAMVAPRLVAQAAEKAGVELGGIRRIVALTETALDQELNEPAPAYAGVTEVAGLLGVSRQRVSELRTSAAFPDPIAELAAGPVWSVPTLTRFISTWERKPGRPRSTKPVDPEERMVLRDRRKRMARKERHVVPNPEGGWDVKAPDADRASSHHNTQAEAERRAKEIMHNAGGGEVVIHGTDGRIRDKDTVAPAKDPFPPRDTKH